MVARFKFATLWNKLLAQKSKWRKKPKLIRVECSRYDDELLWWKSALGQLEKSSAAVLVPWLLSQDLQDHLHHHHHHNWNLQEHQYCHHHRTNVNVINIHFRSPLAPVVVPQRFPSSCPTLTIVLILRYHKISKTRCAPELTRDKVQYRCIKMSNTVHLRMDFVVDD